MKFVANPVTVDAKVITAVTVIHSGCELTLDDGSTFLADSGMCSRYIPVVGDYVVRQEDGYVYLNPKAVFERKYSRAE